MEYGLAIAFFTMTVFMNILNWFSEEVQYDQSVKASQQPCPELYSSWPSMMLFCWFNRIVVTGYKRALTDDDMWQLNKSDSCQAAGEKLSKFWNLEKEIFEALPV